MTSNERTLLREWLTDYGAALDSMAGDASLNPLKRRAAELRAAQVQAWLGGSVHETTADDHLVRLVLDMEKIGTETNGLSLAREYLFKRGRLPVKTSDYEPRENSRFCAVHGNHFAHVCPECPPVTRTKEP
jgi:hypothetical protein